MLSATAVVRFHRIDGASSLARRVSSPEYSISTMEWPLVMGGRSEMTSFTVTVRNGAPSVWGTAEYCNTPSVSGAVHKNLVTACN